MTGVPLNIDWQQILLHLFNFTILKVRNFDEEIRAERGKVNKELADSRERQLAAAKADAEKIVSEARTEAEREKEEIIASAQKEITDMVSEAMEKLTLEQSASDAFDQFLDAAESSDQIL